MAIVKADVVAIAPELASVLDATFAVYIADSAIVFDLNAIREQDRDWYQKNAVAFMLTDQGFGTGASAKGIVVSERVGEVARAYAHPVVNPKLSDSDLSRNGYGRALLRYRRRWAMHIALVGP